MPIVKINIDKILTKECITIDNICEAIHRDVSTKKNLQILKYYRNSSNKRKFSEIM